MKSETLNIESKSDFLTEFQKECREYIAASSPLTIPSDTFYACYYKVLASFPKADCYFQCAQWYSEYLKELLAENYSFDLHRLWLRFNNSPFLSKQKESEKFLVRVLKDTLYNSAPYQPDDMKIAIDEMPCEKCGAGIGEMCDKTEMERLFKGKVSEQYQDRLLCLNGGKRAIYAAYLTYTRNFEAFLNEQFSKDFQFTLSIKPK